MYTTQLQNSDNTSTNGGVKDRLTPVGFMAAVIFACGPYMYATIRGIGLFMFLMVMYIAAVLLQAIRKYGGKAPIKHSRIQRAFVLLVVWENMSYVWSASFDFGNVYTLFKIVVFFLLLNINIYSEKDRKVMRFAMTGTAVLAIYMMLTTVRTIDVSFLAERASFSFFGVAQDPNYMCQLLVVPVVVLLAAALKENTPLIKRIISAILCLFILYGVLYTGSRGGFLGAFIGIISYIIVYRKMSMKKALALVAGAILLFGVYTYLIGLLPDAVSSRFSADAIFRSRYGTSSRTGLWAKYFRTMTQNPTSFLLGYGKNTGGSIIGFGAHNYFVQQFFECGIVGLALSISLLICIFRIAWENKQWIAVASFFGIIVMMMTLSVGSDLRFWLVMVFICISAQYPNEDMEIVTEMNNNFYYSEG